MSELLTLANSERRVVRTGVTVAAAKAVGEATQSNPIGSLVGSNLKYAI